MAKTIMFSNNKGGVCKTTVTRGTAEAMELLGYRVLICEFDEQGNCTMGLGLGEADRYHGITDLLDAKCKKEKKDPYQYITQASENIFILVANGDIKDMDAKIQSELAGLFYLKQILQGLNQEFDYILIDCMPHLGALTTSAMMAADYIVIPTEMESFSIAGIGHVLDHISNMSCFYDLSNLQIAGILPVKVDWRRRNHKRRLEKLLADFEGKLQVYDFIPTSARVADTSCGINIFKSCGNDNAAVAMQMFTEELIRRCG